MTPADHAAALFAARRDREPIPPLTATDPALTPQDAYAIQQEFVQRILADDGGDIVGYKLGLTSKAMQDLLGVHEPDYGPGAVVDGLRGRRDDRSRRLHPAEGGGRDRPRARRPASRPRCHDQRCRPSPRRRGRGDRDGGFTHRRLEDLARRHHRRPCLVRSHGEGRPHRADRLRSPADRHGHHEERRDRGDGCRSGGARQTLCLPWRGWPTRSPHSA